MASSQSHISGFFRKTFRLPSNFKLLTFPTRHSPALTLTRATLIVNRIQQIATLFAFLTLCWIAIDAWFLPEQVWQELAFGRALSCLFFIVLARSCLLVHHIQWVYFRLLLLFVLPVGFLFCANYILHFAHVDEKAQVLVNVYSYSPFIIASGVSFFPLTLAEVTLLLGLPMALLVSIILSTFPDMLMIGSEFSLMWVLLLILVTAALAAVSQLGFMLSIFDDTAHDTLTGLFGRKVGTAILEQQFQTSLRQKAPFCILFVDLDHFKKINDAFGHDAGDKVLKDIADRLKRTTRRQDIVIRWGGEEFLIALPNTDITQTRAFIARLNNEGFGTRPDGQPVTASIGGAECQADKIDHWEALTALADKRLYMAKQAGRNCRILEG